MPMPRALCVLSLVVALGPFTASPVQEGSDLGSIRWTRDGIWPAGDGDGYYHKLAGELSGSVPPSAGADPVSLVLADVRSPGGFGDDATLRGMVGRFVFEGDPWHLFVLAHHLRTQTTCRWGTIWTIDEGSLALLWGCLHDDSDATRRAFALLALQDVHGFRSAPYLEDDALLVRVAAARCLAPPAGVTEAEATPVVSRLLALLGDEHPAIRGAAARALAPWVFLEEHRDALEQAASADPDLGVRAAALEALGAVPCLRSRARLRRVLDDPDAAPALREAARRGLAHAGILP